jgi:hypothetical protein
MAILLNYLENTTEVEMEVDELTELGVHQRYINARKAKGIGTLTEIQETALRNPALKSGKNVLVVAPTSGKTFIGEVLAVKAASELRRVLYLVPYKALAEEKYQDFSLTYGPLGISVVVSSGDRLEFDDDVRRGNFGICITVYEKLAQFLVLSPGVVANCQLLIGNYITVGKPDFHDLAIRNAWEVTEKGQNLLLLPVEVLAELCLKCIEGKITREVLLEFLETRHGYVSRQEADAL